MTTARKPLSPSQAAALRERLESLQGDVHKEPSEAAVLAGIAAMLYLASLILEAEATTDIHRQQALQQRRVALDKLQQRLGCPPTAEDLETCVSPVVPFDGDLIDFIRQDLKAGKVG